MGKSIKDFSVIESKKGTKNYFSPKGKIALMFLKHHACCSDRKLVEQLNSSNLSVVIIYEGTNVF